MHWGDWMMGGWIYMVLFWAVIIAGVVFFIKWAAGEKKFESREDSPLEILKRRYARGEINKEEFELKKKELL
ncbi:MAG: SHOCT domain-containing protein [Bacteroidota bacterium]